MAAEPQTVLDAQPRTVTDAEPRGVTDAGADTPERVQIDRAAVDLYWLPLGAGGSAIVRFNGRVYEAIHAWRAHRRPLELYHCALEVTLGHQRFTIELTPVPDRHGAARGVVREGPVGSRWLSRFRMFRYEVRCWEGGRIPDLDLAVGGPRRLTDDHQLTRRVLHSVGDVPMAVWGRDEFQTGEMWNSNSVIAWLVVRSGLPLELAQPPPSGRAPGWGAGVTLAHRQQRGRVTPRISRGWRRCRA